MNKKWSKKYSECIICGKNDVRHCGYGLCRRCSESRDKKRKLRRGQWYIDNKEKVKEYNKKYFVKYYKENREKIICNNNKYADNKYKNDSLFKLKKLISHSIRQRLKSRLFSKNNKSTFDFLPYTVDDLMRHLEKQFAKGMNWQNYGKWHIDHIRPDCSFKYKGVGDKEFQKCWSLKNLQPLWAIDNLRKNKY